MTIPQLRKLAALYGCPVIRVSHGVDIHDPKWDTKETFGMDDLEYKKPQEFVKVLERLSGKKTAALWTGSEAGK